MKSITLTWSNHVATQQGVSITWWQHLALAGIFAIMTGLLAQLRIYVPWTPVPITGQTMGVLLSGAVLGWRWGGGAQAIYVLLGVCGIPWFAQGEGGLHVLVGPTGGYLAGFVLAATLLGYMRERYGLLRTTFGWVLIMAGSLVTIYALGVAWLWVWYWQQQGLMLSGADLLAKGITPFLLGEGIKLILTAFGATTLIPPKQSP